MDEDDVKENPYFDKCRGIKTFFFEIYHKDGEIELEGFEDYAWATKFELNKYLEEDIFK